MNHSTGNYPPGDNGPRESGEHDENCECSECVPRDECKRCNATMSVEAGDEPTEYCHHCAQEIVSELQADQIWAANVAANNRMANLVGEFDDDEIPL